MTLLSMKFILKFIEVETKNKKVKRGQSWEKGTKAVPKLFMNFFCFFLIYFAFFSDFERTKIFFSLQFH